MPKTGLDLYFEQQGKNLGLGEITGLTESFRSDPSLGRLPQDILRARYLPNGQDADIPLTGSRSGQEYYAIDTATLYIWNGSAWDSFATTSHSHAADTHSLLQNSVHTDTSTQTVSQGSLIYGKNVPPVRWDELTVGGLGMYPRWDGTDLTKSGIVASDIIGGGLLVGNPMTETGNIPLSTSDYSLVSGPYKVLSDITVTSAWIRMYRSGASNIKAKAIIYSEVSGDPDTLVGTSDEVTITATSATWNEFVFSTQPTLSAQSSYFIGVHVESSVPAVTTQLQAATGSISRASSVGASTFYYTVTYGTPDASWNTAGDTQNAAWMLAAYVEGAEFGDHTHAGSGTGGDLTAYIHADGSVAFTGNQSHGDFDITNVGDISLDSISADATDINIKSSVILSSGAAGVSPDGLLHIYGASAGTVTAFLNSLLVLEDNASAFINILTPLGTGGLYFGRGTAVADNDIAAMHYDGTNDIMTIWITGATNSLAINGATGYVEIDMPLWIEIGDTTQTPASNTQLVVENNNDVYINILSGSGNEGGVLFGDSGSATDGYVKYDQDLRRLNFGAATVTQAWIVSGEMNFAAATFIGDVIGIEFNEQATIFGTGPTAGKGRLWVKSSDSKIYYTDDSGTDHDLTAGGGGGGNYFGVVTGDSGTATADADPDTIQFIGGTGITTVAADAPDSLTINLDTPVAVTDGGLGVASPTAGAVLLGSGASAVTPLALPGNEADNTHADRFLRGDATAGTDPSWLAIEQSKSITIETPTATDNITIFWTREAITLLEVEALVTGGTSVTWNLYMDATRTTETTKLWSTDKATSTGATGVNYNSGSANWTAASATIAAGDFIFVKVSAIGGTPTEFHLTLRYKTT